MSTKLRVRRLGYALGAEVSGVDLRKPLDPVTVADIRQALLENVVLCMPGVPLDREQMRVFCSSFGELDDVSRTNSYDPASPGVLVRTNKPVVIDGKQAIGYGGANRWHTDYSYTTVPNPMTFLASIDLPPIGGDTMFANMYVAYETLSPKMKELIEPFRAIHDNSLGSGYARGSAEQRAKMMRINPPVVHRLVQSHPETGRKALYLSTIIRSFVGMTEEESAPILNFLRRHAVSYEFIYRHRWTLGDVLMWDNRCSMHLAVPDYDQSETRRMIRCSLRGPETGTLYRAEDVSLLGKTG